MISSLLTVSYRGSILAMSESDSGLLNSFSSKLTISTKRGRLERSCIQHWSMSWLTADGQPIGAGNLKPSFMDFITCAQIYKEEGETPCS